MSRIRSNGNCTTELRFIDMLRKHKITKWRRNYKLHGRPDFVFAYCKLAVFIDGDFWHGNPKKLRVPKSNRAYWIKKIVGNRARDREVNKALKKMGWRVVRFWESTLRDESAIMDELKSLL